MKKKKRSMRRFFSPEKSAFIYLLPMVVFMLIMVAYPIGRILYLSLTSNILTRPDLGIQFIGLENYWKLFSSQAFWETVGRTGLWTALSVGGKTLIAFGIALLLAKDIAFKRFYLILLMLPWVTPMVVAAVTWRWIYDGQFGMLNYILTQVHILQEPYVFLGEKWSAFVATAITDMWLGIPFLAMMFLAGLQSIPVELHESANMDGANRFQKLFHVTLPVMKPIILVATTMSGIWTFNSFGVIWPMTSGGPVDATQTLIVQAYKQSFGSFNLGMGAAIAVVIFIILTITTILYKRLLMRQEEL
ncbi:sugar ABC transporter permease [Halobacillus salinarum]|uniref:Sugar ABC transporter permease n=1 Tax=Halobacillus salinarum TaxID=2932257 RepID=A0ABY4EN83_9BACI|nr:sugar ABC transporter permease [Halobacillus salinarum]UOQ45440.1 sugar ABC transporter permease [Halobacillus salinarum]